VNVAMHMSPTGHTPALRVVTRDQLAQALHAKKSPIVIWDSNLAAPFARLLWVQKFQWWVFAKLADMLIDDISHEYGVKFGDDWIINRHTDGEIILLRVAVLKGNAPAVEAGGGGGMGQGAVAVKERVSDSKSFLRRRAGANGAAGDGAMHAHGAVFAEVKELIGTLPNAKRT
jgi:hypothetical protein